MNIRAIQIYINNEWLDISSNIETKQSIVIQSRCDEAFATGSFVAWLDIPFNIPPYTPLKIDDEMYLCSSTCKRHLIERTLYIHEFEILELTAYMSCWILGSKNFSATGTKKKDRDKLAVIAYLMQDKYDITFTTTGFDFEQIQEFTFGPGTTMYDAYTEIMNTYNRKPKISSFNPATNSFELSYIDLSATTEFVIEDDKVLYTECRQNIDNYGNMLEFEASNVIDRDMPIVVSNLTPRWETVQMDADNNKLILPTRIEKVNKFSVIFPKSMNCLFLGIPITEFKYCVDGKIDSSYDGTIKTLYEWCLDTVTDGSTKIDNTIIYKLFLQLVKDYPTRVSINDMREWRFEMSINTFTVDLNWVGRNAIEDEWAPCKIDISKRILEASEYNCLEAKDKAAYCYYTSGDYYIDGLATRYKDDFWNAVLSNSEGPFLKYIAKEIAEANTRMYYDSINNGQLTRLEFRISIVNPEESINVSFDIEYIPIVDMYIKDRKDVIPINESGYKNIARSYNNGANFIDFNRLDYSINRVNDSLGLEEYSVEYNIKDSAIPVPGQYVNYAGVKWYIASVNRTISLINDVAMINLVRDYNKIADAIGVQTQFNTTKFPLNNVIDRNIYVENHSIVSINKDIYFCLEVNGNELYKPAVILTGNKGLYVYCEAIDQYAFDRMGEQLNGDYVKITDVPYRDEFNGITYNEIYKCNISLRVIDRILSLAESYALPYYNGLYEEQLRINDILVYKDARERLLFTIFLPNATLKQ